MLHLLKYYALKQAQDLRATITTASKFLTSDHKLYIKCDGFTVLGFLKVGQKKLFYRDELGGIKEIYPMCILDFYVDEINQRNGHGKVYKT